MIPPVVPVDVPDRVNVVVLLEISIVEFVPAVSVKLRFVEAFSPV